MKRAPLSVLLVLLCSAPAFCQLSQLHPELCGEPTMVVSLPRDFSAVVDRDNIVVNFFKNGAAFISVTALLDQISEVCPLSDGRLVVFGASSGGLPGAASIYIVDETKPALVDSFGGYQPLMSPDQRWIAYRKAYSPHDSEPVSEEYLMYDLSRSPAQNRAASVPLEDTTDVGTAIFPLGQKNLPFDADSGLPEDQLHSAASDLFWSPDSKALAFADGLLGKTSLVLVTVDKSGATGAFVHPLDGAPECAVGGYPVTHIEFGPEQGTDRVMFFDFAADCARTRLELHRDDFQVAKTEVHTPRKYTRKAIKADR